MYFVCCFLRFLKIVQKPSIFKKNARPFHRQMRGYFKTSIFRFRCMHPKKRSKIWFKCCKGRERGERHFFVVDRLLSCVVHACVVCVGSFRGKRRVLFEAWQKGNACVFALSWARPPRQTGKHACIYFLPRLERPPPFPSKRAYTHTHAYATTKTRKRTIDYKNCFPAAGGREGERERDKGRERD